MKASKIQIKEKERLSALYRHQILDTESETMYDSITEFTADLCQTPIALINFVDNDRLWVKSGKGLDRKEIPRNHSFCSYTIEQKGIFEVPDARKDERFKDTHHVVNQNVVFYAGIPIRDTEGHALGTLCVIDVKPRKLCSQQKKGLRLFANQVSELLTVKKAKIRYETLIESSRDMIYELDENGKFLFANKSTIAKTGYSLEKLKTMTCWELIQEETRDKVKSHYIAKIKEGENSIYHEFPIVDRSGCQIWLGQSVDYAFDNDRVSRAYVIAKDVTELVQTRQMLKESEEKIMAEKNLLNMMVFSSPAAIAMFSKNFRYLAFSEKWNANKDIYEQIVGLDPGTGNEKQLELQELIKKRVFEGGVIEKKNDLVVTGDGKERWIEWVATPWNNTTDGSVGGIIVYANDITHIINHEAELQKAYEEAEKSSKIKEDFLSSMSHEIRTPLNAIIGTTNLLMEENTELAENEKFKLLKFSSNNLLALINNVLDFSKIESGNISLENRDFEFGTLAKSLVSSWMPLAKQKGIELILNCDERMPNIVKGDSVRISQILNNLVNNALKFTKKGFVQVNIMPDTRGNNYVSFEVQDSGIGIPKEKQKIVFESFKQVTNHSTYEEGGTGLGLPICKKLVSMMGADLKLSSQKGFGSKFSFTIKLEPGDVSNILDIVEDKGRKQLDVEVLLVEDNRANQFIAKSFLEKWGVTLSIASNGLEALEHIKSKSFDMILLDIKMPVMDGYMCAERIRKMEGEYFQNVPIIALTASTILDVRRKGSLLDFDDFLGKPFDPKQLYTMLVKYADRVLQLDTPYLTENEEKRSFTEGVKASSSEEKNITDNLRAYTEGDPGFFIEFTENIIDNLLKIRSEIPLYLMKRDVEGLGDLIHMVKPTIEIIEQRDLLETLSRLRSGWRRERIDEETLLEAMQRIDEKIEVLSNILTNTETEEFVEL